MSYLGDYVVGDSLDFKFTTRRFSTGAPFTLAGTPAVAAYPDNSVTELTAGITLSVDFDARTGLNNVRVVATGGNGYAAGSTYALVITAGTVDGVSVVGEVVGEFTLGRSAAFGRLGAPAGASVSADIAAVQADTDNVQTRIPAALVSGRIDASVGAMAADVVTAAAIAAGAIGVSEAPNLDAAISTRATPAQVNAEVVDALTVDTIAELAQATPTATPTIVAALMLLYMAMRDRLTVTSTTKTISNDAGTVIAKKALSDDGTTYIEAEMISGP